MTGGVQAPPTFRLPAYLAVALVAGSIIAYELAVMRHFAIGGWSHVGSLVIAIAMLGFGLFSTVLCLRTEWFQRRSAFWIRVALVVLGPAMVLANTLAQRLPFNAIFLVSDPRQKFYLLGYFLLYVVPFLAGAMFLGLVFLEGQAFFGRVYFADLAGSGVGGLVLLGAMAVLFPERLLLVPLALWFAGAVLWFLARREGRFLPWLVGAASLAAVMVILLPQIVVSPYKGVSYARKFPDARRILAEASPLGFLEVYQSTYFHFAPGLSDTASLRLASMPDNAFLGMYIDGDGPIGIMKKLPPEQTAYLDFLPMALPYLVKKNPEVLVMQVGGGISTRLALQQGARKITAAEGNPLVLRALRDDPVIGEMTGNLLRDPRVQLVPRNARTVVRENPGAYDIVDLSLADSTGLSNPGGSSIYERYLYTEESFLDSMRALRPGGILSVTTWNKEDPPKSTLKLLATLVAAARRHVPGADVRDRFFITHTYLSTLTVLYKEGGFTSAETAALDRCCRGMSFETVWAPGRPVSTTDRRAILEAYRSVYFPDAAADGEIEGETDLSAGRLYQVAAASLLGKEGNTFAEGYVFDTRPLTDDRPYFAGFIKPKDILAFTRQLESISDEWGYLLLWATLAVSLVLAAILVALPAIFGWRAIFAPHRGKSGVIVYFACLGLGYILVEIGLISRFMQILDNPTVSASVLITGMLIFSGLGSLASGRFLPDPRRALGVVAVGVPLLLVGAALGLGHLLAAAGGWPYPARILACLLLLAPAAFLMGFPFALGMGTLARLGREHFFVWAWGINGSFSVAGSVLVPLLAVNVGLSGVLLLAGVLYAAIFPAFLVLSLKD